MDQGGRAEATRINHFGEPQVIMAVSLLHKEIDQLRNRVSELTKSNVALEKENVWLRTQQQPPRSASETPQPWQPASAWYSYGPSAPPSAATLGLDAALQNKGQATPAVAAEPNPQPPPSNFTSPANLTTTAAKRLFDPPSTEKGAHSADVGHELAMPLSPDAPDAPPTPESSDMYDEVHVQAHEITYDGVVYFLESSTGKVYKRDGDNDFVGKMQGGKLDFDAVDSDVGADDSDSD